MALEKIRLYHLTKGNYVSDYEPISGHLYDEVYASSIFTFTDKSYVTNHMICGGTGFDLKTELPPEIEAMRPRINIGFTTRGCCRKCPFCVVPAKEGKIHSVASIEEIWDGVSKEITLLDNNILALPDWFYEVCEDIYHNDLVVDFNQGLDIRLVNNEIARWLSFIKHKKQIRFAWDSIKDEPIVMNGISVLTDYIQPHRIMFYVLVGFNTTEEEDIYRVMKLKEMGIDSFAMNYNRNPERRDFARWVNHKAIFKTVPWLEYKRRPG